MKSLKLPAFIAAIVLGIIAALYFAAASRKDSPSFAMRPGQIREASGEQQPKISALAQPTANSEQATRASVAALKQNVKAAHDNLVATQQIPAEDVPTSASEERDRLARELEQRLIDSMSSLTQQMIADPTMTSNVLAMLEGEEDPQIMMMLARALGEAGKDGKSVSPDRLLKMAQNDPSLARREAALLALSYIQNPSAELREQVADISRNAPTTELRNAAISTLGSFMSNNRDLVQSISESLLKTREASDDIAVRGMVLQTIGNMDAPLSGKVFEAMSEAVLSEPESLNRSLAAVALGSGATAGTKEAVLAALQKAYLAEVDINTQRHILTQITKAAKFDAEEYLRALPTPNPLLAQDVKDYIEILSSTDRNNWGAVWDQKSERDHTRGTYPSSHGGHGTDDR